MRQVERRGLGDLSMRLGPIHTRSVPGVMQGRCAACQVLIAPTERVVRIYGEVFHSGCAFHSPQARA